MIFKILPFYNFSEEGADSTYIPSGGGAPGPARRGRVQTRPPARPAPSDLPPAGPAALHLVQAALPPPPRQGGDSKVSF